MPLFENSMLDRGSFRVKDAVETAAEGVAVEVQIEFIVLGFDNSSWRSSDTLKISLWVSQAGGPHWTIAVMLVSKSDSIENMFEV
jgi:hypothetical protein